MSNEGKFTKYEWIVSTSTLRKKSAQLFHRRREGKKKNDEKYKKNSTIIWRKTWALSNFFLLEPYLWFMYETVLRILSYFIQHDSCCCPYNEVDVLRTGKRESVQ